MTAGQAHDLTQAATLPEGIKTEAVIADKAFDANALSETIEQAGATVVIPPKADRIVQRDFDRHPYKHRNLIERFFMAHEFMAHETFPTHRNSIRQARQSLLVVHRRGRELHLVGLTVNTT